MAAGNVRSSAAGSEADRELVFTRVFDAPRDLVFEAWTDPNHIVQWWGPTGFTTTTYTMDVRPGGVWRFVMHGPDGVDYQNRIVYIEIVKPERLVYKHAPDKDTEPVGFEVTVTFADQGGKTELTMRMLFPTAAARNHVVKKYGAVEGAYQTLGRLAEQLAKMSGRELVLTRTFDAPRQVVFNALTDPARLQRWWGPKGFTNPVCEVDPRPGGAIRIHMRAPNGVVYPMTGVYREVVDPERLVFSSAALDEKGNPLFEIVNELQLGEAGGKTILTLRASVVMTTDGAERFLAGMEMGWSQSFDRLDTEVIA